MKNRWILAAALLLPLGAALAQQTDDFAIPGDAETEAEAFLDGAQIAPDPVEDWAAAPAPATATAPPAAPQPAAAPPVEIPADWTRHSRLGMSFATPPDWQVMEESDDSISVGLYDRQAMRAAMVGIDYIVPGQIDSFEKDIGDLPQDASKGLDIDLGGATPTVTEAEPVVAADGARLIGKRAELIHPDLYFYAQEYQKEARNERGGADGLMMMAINFPREEILPILEIIEASVTLDAAPPPEAETGLDGIVGYPMPLPTGWKRWTNMQDALAFATSPVYSASIVFETGYRARGSWDGDDEFANPPDNARGEILGQPASVKSGLTGQPYMQVGYSMVPALRTVYRLDLCLANGDPVVIQTYAAEKWLETSDYAPLLDVVTLTLPPDAIPCPQPGEEPAAPVVAQPAPPPPPVAQGGEAASGWTVYQNARFGTSVRYPQSHFAITGQPPENDDGRAFASPDGTASMLVWGGFNALGQTIAEMASEAAEWRDTAAMEVFLTGDTWFSVKYRDGGIVTRRQAILDGQDVLHSVLIRYPETQEADFGPVAEAIVTSLAAPTDTAPAPVPPVPQADPMEQAFWQSVRGSSYPADFRAYLQNWPQGQHADEARRRIAELEAPPPAPQVNDTQMELAFWQSIQGANEPAMYQAYLDQWPNGTFASLARLQIQRLGGSGVAPDPSPGVITMAPPPPPQPAARYYTPSRGTAERQAVMDAARVPVQAELGQPVIFLVSVLNCDGTWCYLQAEPLRPDGTKLDWRTTPYARDWAADVMSDVVMVLMRRQGSGYQAVDHIIGPTDVYWYNWLAPYGLPERLFNPNG
ncbi:tetratricopeptide repeat protein [Thetidibacter halocola]|uniref:Uncharacterized protein n=1 Tax=Thetidibacter halocola TaxID=2827239 RepID=A0A8J8B8B3_9RHOB|nr:hypothetical protein [Thetidibacter halocola]MBS0126031.1 hypothetical protein [Thetidibacter halocola]